MKLELLSRKVFGGEHKSTGSTKPVGSNSKKKSVSSPRKSVSPPPLSVFPRRPRPRSSPTRTQTNINTFQRYSPTISCSTVAAVADGKPNENFCERNDSNENLEQRIYSFGPTKAYFSTKPPISPSKIVMVGEINQGVSTEDRAQRLLENIRKMEDALKVTTLRREFLNLEESLKSHSLKSSSDRSRRRLRNFDTSGAKSLRAKKSNIRIFRHWLNGLISNLPIPVPEPGTDLYERRSTSSKREKFRLLSVPMSPVQSFFQSPYRIRNSRNGSAKLSQRYSLQSKTSRQSSKSLIKGNASTPMRSPTHSSVGTSSKRLSRCNIAVQALTSHISTAAMSTIASVPNLEIPNEWIGGVRALRDSHVRLVLKQLRHIDKLNRALDRAVRGTGTKHSRKN